MKKILTVLMAAMMMYSITACAGKQEAPVEEVPVQEAPAEEAAVEEVPAEVSADEAAVIAAGGGFGGPGEGYVEDTTPSDSPEERGNEELY